MRALALQTLFLAYCSCHQLIYGLNFNFLGANASERRKTHKAWTQSTIAFLHSERRPLNRNIKRSLSNAWPTLIVHLLFPHWSLGNQRRRNGQGGKERERERAKEREGNEAPLELNKHVLKQYQTDKGCDAFAWTLLALYPHYSP